MILCRSSVELIEERAGDRLLSVVPVLELHDLQVGVLSTSEDGREVGRHLKGHKNEALQFLGNS